MKNTANPLHSLRIRMVDAFKTYFKSLASTYSATQANAEKPKVFGGWCGFSSFIGLSKYVKKWQKATLFHCKSIAVRLPKRYGLVAALLVILAPGMAGAGWTDDWCVNGIPLSRFRDAGVKEYAQLGGGIALTYLVHWGSHVAYMEAEGIEWRQDGLAEIYCETGMSDSQQQWCGRIGSVGALAGGVALKFSPWGDTWLATGYFIGTAAEIITYPATGCKDFDTIRDHGGNWALEYGIYSATAIYLLSPKKRRNDLAQETISEWQEGFRSDKRPDLSETLSMRQAGFSPIR